MIRKQNLSYISEVELIGYSNQLNTEKERRECPSRVERMSHRECEYTDNVIKDRVFHIIYFEPTLSDHSLETQIWVILNETFCCRRGFMSFYSHRTIVINRCIYKKPW
jgi:hypothetical protein